MKAPTVFLGGLTNSELESWLEKSSTVIIPNEIARRVGQ
jgi:hypothetical protein